MSWFLSGVAARFQAAHLGQQYSSTDVVLALVAELWDPALVYESGQAVAGWDKSGRQPAPPLMLK